MSRNEFGQGSHLTNLSPSEKSKFIEVLNTFDSQKINLKDLHNIMSIGEILKPNHVSSSEDDYWNSKWVISHSVVSGRQLSRWGCAAASIDDKIYLFGGRGSDSRPRNSFHILDLAANHFSIFKTNNTPKGREGHSMTAYKNLLVIYGGCESGGDENDPFEDIWIVDIETKTWKKPNTTGKKPEAREGHAAGVIRNFMVIYGGSGIKALLSNMYSFNLTTFEWKELEQHGAQMGVRESMSSVVVNDYMYIFGGNISDHSSENDEYTDDFFIVTFKNYTAMCKKILTNSPSPPKRLSHSLSNLKNRYLILFGGESFGKALNDIWVYTIEKNIWHEIKPQNQIPGRMAHVCFCYKDSLIVYGGMTKDQSGFGKALNDIWVYTIEKNIWHEIKPQNQIPGRMAHVCFCYKDSLIVYGGMTKDQSVRSDLAILKFGKCEINISNGSGVNPKRKFTKILNVTTRTVPLIAHQDHETAISSCEQCGHSLSCCKFLSRYSMISYPILNYFPRIQVSSYSIEQMASMFQDPFAAMFRISEVMNTPNVSFNIIGTTNMKGNQVVKILPSEIQKDHGNIKNYDNNVENYQKHVKNSGIIQVPILEISSKIEFMPDQVAKFCSGVASLSFLPAFFKLSDTAVVVSRSSTCLTVALMHKNDFYIPLFFAVFDNNGEPLYPKKDLVHANMVNVYSRSHLQSADIFRHPPGTSIFLYTKDLESIVGDILYQGNSFSHLVSKAKNVQFIVAGTLIKKDKQNKDEFINRSLLYKTNTNAFLVLVYVKKKLVYWEFKKNEKGKRAREECTVVKLVEDEFICKVTGQLSWNLKTFNIFADLYSPMKKRLIE
ncbi:hypothetical protein SteCoe_33412 [Stentor coeruleus]|uniref:Uncharacterized protein n=1 Tax=Stentor coeruleus TaxID=5963 RepID=A0A1R2AWU2_9CILI|nr:hypothetical protein SteCoe_33412 [Stentor coeruleus]